MDNQTTSVDEIRSEYDLWRSKSERQLADEYLTGVPDPSDRAWWICHWQWKYSPYWRKLCVIDEALQVLAWEADPPVLSPEDDAAFSAIARLNVHAHELRLWRLEQAHQKRQIYWLKREAIKLAMHAGLILLRLVESRVPCRTCGATGVYHVQVCNDEWEGSRCRRCRGRGAVALQFIECNVADRYLFHQPYDHTHPFAGHQIDRLQPHAAGTWSPNKPGAELAGEEAADLIAGLKRRYWEPQPHYVKEIYGKSLNWEDD